MNPPAEELFARKRRTMVDEQLRRRGITDTEVLSAMAGVPRHEFIPEKLQDSAYEDWPLPIGWDQTISQPYIVGFMLQATKLNAGMRILDVGAGSGYQTALLETMGADVDAVEIVPQLAERAQTTLNRLGFTRARVWERDGFSGLEERAPFDRILLAAAPLIIPQPLLDQLKIGGRLIAPVGREIQDLVMVHRNQEGYFTEKLLTVKFVPMTGKCDARKEER